MVVLIKPRESDGEDFSDLSMAYTKGGTKGPDSATSPEPDSFFEFFFTGPSEMCAAEDIILRGKLLPFGAPPPPPPPPPTRRSDTRSSQPAPAIRHRRSSSLGQPTGCWNRGGLTAEYRKLRRVSDSNPDPRGEPQPKPRPPKWFVFAFGSMRVPAGMDIGDIRIRQRRRRTPAEDRWAPWKLIRSLSCKGVETVVVTTATPA